jgi:uncharacterized membrane protein YphA (DoxX/SURF4 family)
MNKKAFNILRFGLGITFIWIGVLIIKDPSAWAGYVKPWVLQYMSGSVESMMVQTGYWDILFGVLMLIPRTVWIGAIFGAMHLVVVLVASGVTEVTVRDIGLLFACTALFIEAMPSWISDRLKFLK